MKQLGFEKAYGSSPSKHRYSYGGTLRKKKAGRGMRPLSTRAPLHLVLKARKDKIKYGLRTWKRYALIHFLLQKYAHKFFVKIEQVSIQGDHIHLLIRTSRRSNYQSFFRVFAGQIAQQFQKQGLLTWDLETKTKTEVTDTPQANASTQVAGTKGLWLHRPWTRVVIGRRAWTTVQNYVRLNEQEALHRIVYRKERLRGLSAFEWEILWS